MLGEGGRPSTPSTNWVLLVNWLGQEKLEALSSGEEGGSGFSRVEKLSPVDYADAAMLKSEARLTLRCKVHF